MSTVTLFHNPRCSKSRQALQLLEDRGVDVKVVRYLEQPPTLAELKKLSKALELEPRAFMRTTEADYKQQNLADDTLTKTDLLKAIVRSPKLLQRPIAWRGARAVIGRPPEKVLDVL